MIGPNNQHAINYLKLSAFVACVIFVFSADLSFSQEKQDLPNEDFYHSQDELNPHTDNPVLLNKDKEALRDSLMVKPMPASRTKPDGSNSTRKNQEETLSFNVLYFIIQKFKVSDMIN